MWVWNDRQQGYGQVLPPPPPSQDEYGRGLMPGGWLQNLLARQAQGGGMEEEAIMGAIPDFQDPEVEAVLSGDDEYGRSEEKLEEVLARKKAELAEQKAKLAAADNPIARGIHKKRIKGLTKDIERLEAKLAKKAAKSSGNENGGSDNMGSGTQFRYTSAPPGQGRLVFIDMYVSSDVSSGDFNGTKANSSLIKAVVPASGETSELSLYSSDMPYAKVVIVGLRATTVPQRDTGSDFQIRFLGSENDANLLLSPSSKWSDISPYRVEDVTALPGLRQYPTIVSPNKVNAVIRAVGDNGDAVRGSFQLVCEVIEDTVSSGARQMQKRAPNAYAR